MREVSHLSHSFVLCTAFVVSLRFFPVSHLIPYLLDLHFPFCVYILNILTLSGFRLMADGTGIQQGGRLSGSSRSLGCPFGEPYRTLLALPSSQQFS